MSGHPVSLVSETAPLSADTKNVKNIVVLGATGMLGSTIVRVLSDVRCVVVAIARGDHGFDASDKDGLTWLSEYPPPDFVVNCAAITRFSKP